MNASEIGLFLLAALLFALSVVLFNQMGVQWAASTPQERRRAVLFVLLTLLGGFWCLAAALGQQP